MKKLLILPILALLLCCESDGGAGQRCDVVNPSTINLANPQYINLATPGGWAYGTGGPRGLILYNAGTFFRAFSRECPQSTSCTEVMVVEKGIKIVCPCDETEYSILDGSPLTEGISASVCEFKVSQVSADVLKVSNF